MQRKVARPSPREPVGRFPAELERFLSRPTYSLLIKGASGTGKSILALTIMGSLKKSESILYISTRSSPDQILTDYPWTRKLFGAGLAETGRGTARGEGWETLVDARLDEPGAVFERITNILMDKHAPTVVVDSWESLDDSVDKEALRTNIRVLQTWCERARARFIFVGENTANTAIDPIVEGVLVLSEQTYQGRRLREVSLSKLHGVQISRPSYFYSLEGGVFHSFDRSKPDDIGLWSAASFKGVKEPADPAHHTTGFRVLDEELSGGYPLKSVVWVEVDPRVDSRVTAAFLAGTIREWAASGKGVVLQKSEEIDPDYVGRIRSSLGSSGGERIMVWGSASLDKFKEVGKIRKDEAPGARLKPPEEDARLMTVVDWEKITSSAAPGEARDAESAIDFLKRRADLSIVVARSNPAQLPPLGLVSAHIKIVEINGTLFAMSEKPWSELYALVTGRPGGKEGMDLERVV